MLDFIRLLIVECVCENCSLADASNGDRGCTSNRQAKAFALMVMHCAFLSDGNLCIVSGRLCSLRELLNELSLSAAFIRI